MHNSGVLWRIAEFTDECLLVHLHVQGAHVRTATCPQNPPPQLPPRRHSLFLPRSNVVHHGSLQSSANTDLYCDTESNSATFLFTHPPTLVGPTTKLFMTTACRKRGRALSLFLCARKGLNSWSLTQHCASQSLSVVDPSLWWWSHWYRPPKGSSFTRSPSQDEGIGLRVHRGSFDSDTERTR